MKETLTNLLDKYYAGDSSSEEEALLKKELPDVKERIFEKDIFSFYSAEAILPEGMEESIFSVVIEKANNRRYRFRIYSLLSAAAVLLLLVTLFPGYLREKKTEKDFRIMEQALNQVSESLQPDQDEPEMLVLWIDNNVEIIIN